MFPLSPSQEIVWLHEELFPDSRAYHFTAVLDLVGSLDPEALRRSMAAVLDRHAGLRLELVGGGARPMQRVRPVCTPRLRMVSLVGRTDAEECCEELLREQHEMPFARSEAPLLRWCLVALDTDRHRLLHTEHHLIHDGWSFALVLRDLFTTYSSLVGGLPAELPPAGSYEDYVRRFGGREWHEHRRRALDHWLRELAGIPLGAPLPGLTRLSRGPGAEFAGGQLRQLVAPDLAGRLSRISSSLGHTPFSTLLCLFAELMRRLTGQRELIVGTAAGNRPAGFEETVGMFVNTIPLRLVVDEGRPAVEAVDDVTDVLLRNLPYQDIPVQDLTRELGLRSATGLDNPLFPVMFSAHDAPLPALVVPDLDISLFEGFNSGTSRFDIDAVLIPDAERVVGPHRGGGGMVLVWDYAADLLERSEIAEVCGHYLDLVSAYTEDPTRPLGALATGGGLGE